MERVIMLKWFKKITNRLFGEDDDKESSEIHQAANDEIEISYEETKEKPAFRFPIITDAEIYGWDEEVPTKGVKEERSSSLVVDDDYEPIPLYKNERWPENNTPGNLYKVNKKEIPSLVSKKVNGKAEHEFKKEAKRNSTVRFVPSEVPSPIYGFSERSKPVDDDLIERERFTLSKDEFVLETHAPVEIEEKKVTTHQFELSKELAEKESLMQSKAEEIKLDDPIKDTEILEDKLVEEPNHMNLSENEASKKTQDLEEEVVEDSTVEHHNVEIVEPVVENYAEEIEETQNRGDQEPTHTEELVDDIVEATELPSNESIVEASEPEREKIVPFNVLMLKSDKEKLAIREMMSQSIPTSVIDEKEEVSTVEPEQETFETVSEIEEPIEELPIVEESPELEHYVFPSIDYLIPPETQVEDVEWLTSQSEKLEESLSHFGVTATVIEAVQGPTVTRFEFTVGQGTKVSRVRNLTDDLKLTLAARDIRIQAPIPGKSSIGIEIPNRQTRPVRISEVIQTDAFMESESPLEAVLGLGLTGDPVTIDLRKMPHGMIAGATGSGKSVCINSILVSLLYKASPSELKMMLIDPKMVELAPFNGIPHLISPVITDVKAATAALKWAVNEMERRYELLAHVGVRDIERYNKVAEENRQYSLKMPYLLIVIDELADLMMMAPADVEVSISRIAQKARACGIHLIIATQRPSVDVITGTIKANIPTRIAFSVSSQVDSRTIIDTNGAERLLGRGDMLYIGNGESTSVRLQGTFVTDDEIERIIEHVQAEASPKYLFGQDDLLKNAIEEEEEDPLFIEACRFIYEQDSASTSMLQRSFSIGYNRAAKLMDRMEKLGFISEQQGSRARDVYLTESELNKLNEAAF